MFKTGKLMGVALVVLAMSGCAAGIAEGAPMEATSAPVESAAPSQTPSAMPAPESPATPVAAPITMEPVAPDERSEAQKAGFADDDAWFLAAIRSSWSGETPTDEQLLGAGALACESLEAGADPASIVVVQGGDDIAAHNNQTTVDYAIMALCPA
jgi:hypothetical protein